MAVQPSYLALPYGKHLIFNNEKKPLLVLADVATSIFDVSLSILLFQQLKVFFKDSYNERIPVTKEDQQILKLTKRIENE
jgi:hypothetical protein